MNYRYVAFNQQGQRAEGVIEVPNESAAEQVLWNQGLTVVKLTPARDQLSLYALFPTFFGVKRRDLIIFSRQLATLLSSGISILPALRLLAEQSAKRALREVLQEVMTTLEQGQSFSAALSAFPFAFPELYVHTISVGERTGNLEDVLRQMATYMEKEQALARKLTTALAYPVFVLVVAIGVTVLMLTTALPPMVELFETFGADLPWPTRAVMALSRFTSAYGIYLLFGGLILAGAFAWWGNQPTGRRLRDATLLRVPILGRVILQGQLARFAQTAAVLINAGLPLSEVMELVLQVIENVLVAEAIDRARVALLAGRGLSTPLADEPLLPPLLAQMVRVGEETGTLETNLETLATFYEDEVDRSVQLMSSMVEPVMTVFIALLVGFIAVSMVMPMYSIMSEIK